MRKPQLTMNYILACCLIGVLMGVLSGLIGVGGGIIAVPAMIYFLGMDPRVAMGTSLAIIVPVALAGAMKRFHQGDVNVAAFVCISVLGMGSAVFGAWLSSQLSSLTLQRTFAVFMILVGIKMMFPGAQKPQPTTGENSSASVTDAATAPPGSVVGAPVIDAPR
jgi:hypothetical protein